MRNIKNILTNEIKLNMKPFQIEIPEGKEAKWVDGVLTLVDEKPIEYKFKVGDKVKIVNGDGITYTITKQFVEYGTPAYELECDGMKIEFVERWLELIPSDITERIKTFDDAYQWCETHNSESDILEDFSNIVGDVVVSDDLLAYLKLRIITAALNEGWEPTCEMRENGELVEDVFVSNLGNKKAPVIRSTSIYSDSSAKLCFKSEDLALYAAKQFRDIYADFCGCKKGGEG